MRKRRTIVELRWAKALAGRPSCIPVSRPRGIKAEGIRFERALARSIDGAVNGQWFEFEDQNGHGYCQTDILILGSRSTLIIECKLSWTDEGHRAIDELYGPVVEHAFGKPVLGIVACKYVNRGHKGQVAGYLDDALNVARIGRESVLLWSPNTPLFHRIAA